MKSAHISSNKRSKIGKKKCQILRPSKKKIYCKEAAAWSDKLRHVVISASLLLPSSYSDGWEPVIHLMLWLSESYSTSSLWKYSPSDPLFKTLKTYPFSVDCIMDRACHWGGGWGAWICPSGCIKQLWQEIRSPHKSMHSTNSKASSVGGGSGWSMRCRQECGEGALLL